MTRGALMHATLANIAEVKIVNKPLLCILNFAHMKRRLLSRRSTIHLAIDYGGGQLPSKQVWTGVGGLQVNNFEQVQWRGPKCPCGGEEGWIPKWTSLTGGGFHVTCDWPMALWVVVTWWLPCEQTDITEILPSHTLYMRGVISQLYNRCSKGGITRHLSTNWELSEYALNWKKHIQLCAKSE